MPQKTYVLVIESNSSENEKLCTILAAEGFKVHASLDAASARADIAKHTPDIVLLSLHLPDATGLALMVEIQEKTSAQVIIVTSKNELTDKIIGLELGADDYITKPFETRELVARVNARMRRNKQIKKYLEEIKGLRAQCIGGAYKLKFNNWILDRQQWQAYDSSGVSANLTTREFSLLESLVMESNCVLTRDQLMDKAWHGNNNTTDRAVDIHILRIRKKIENSNNNEKIIKSIRGVGYQLACKVERVA